LQRHNPSQNAETFVQYKVNATDIMETKWYASGKYTVKNSAALNVTLAQNKIVVGQRAKVLGTMSPASNGTEVDVQFTTVNSAKILNCTTNSNGAFIVNWRPTAAGIWAVMASTNETQLTFGAYSQQLMLTVAPAPLYVRYSLYIIIGFVTLVAVGGVAFFLSSRRS